MSSTAVDRYRDQEFLTAPPGRLVVLTFDALFTALTRARIGVSSGNVDLVMKGSQQARDLLTELLATLDQEKGGEIARNLASLYVFSLKRLHGLPKKGDTVRFDQVITLLTPIRDAFAEIASTPAASASRAVA